MNASHRGVAAVSPSAALARALTALCCLWSAGSACGDGIAVPPNAELPTLALPGAAEDGSIDPLAAPVGEPPLPDPDAPTTTLQAPLEPWPLSFSASELAAIDDAIFSDDALLVAGRAGDQVVIQRLHRKQAGGVVSVSLTAPTERFARVRGGASRLSLVRSGAGVLALWLADGHLEGLAIESASKDLVSLEPVRLSGEEGGQLAGPLVAAASAGGVVACAKDKLGPTCFEIAATQPEGLRKDGEAWTEGHPALASVSLITKKTAIGEPRALVPLDAGLMLVLGNCKSETCSRIDLMAIALDEHGVAGKRRDLPVVQLDRGTAFIPDGDGFVLVARRVGAGEHSAWRVSAEATRELQGRFSRVVGGFAHDDRTLLIERAHLKMRKGFPVRGYQVRPLTEAAERKGGGRRKGEVEREALPEAIAEHLPTDPDQSFTANGDALVFVAPLRKGHFDATVLRLLER